jgi:hypothetical protein
MFYNLSRMEFHPHYNKWWTKARKSSHGEELMGRDRRIGG